MHNSQMDTPLVLEKLDKIISTADQVMRALWAVPEPSARPSPTRSLAGLDEGDDELDQEEKRHAQGLMRVNHTGEICAQALYQGQAMTTRSKEIRAHLRSAADEERDHLSWCAERIKELGGKPSLLNPAFYAASFLLGSGVGLLDSRIGLGFVSATEDEVCEHLDRHLQSLPERDTRSRAVLQTMREEEGQHGADALGAGGSEFPKELKELMRLSSKLMTESTYHM